MKVFFKFSLLLLLIFQLCSCKKKELNPNQALQLEAFSNLRTSSYTIHPGKIRQHLDRMMKADVDSMQPDYRTRSYYGQHGSFLWIDRLGVDARADTLLAYLRTVDQVGFSPKKFYVKDIENDLKRLRTLDFDTASNTISQVMARLEYHLTKAYLRYVNGQQFGYTNPFVLFNKLDVRKRDSINVGYRELFDLSMQRPTKYFWTNALQKIRHDSVGIYLQAIQPHGKLYDDLKQRLPKAVGTAARRKVICNLERARWRLDDEPDKHEKYVVINLPSMHLMARDHDSTLIMRVGMGALSTKTPLITSKIIRMDINPQWVMPRSIIEKSVVPQAGNKDYFDARRYFIRERKTGKRMDVTQVSADMLKSGQYFVIQEGGKGNAMGRIVFRFKNKFAIYLHDTSSREVFEKGNRGVSHGCIRLEKPFDFAVFLLGGKDEEAIERIRYSMEADIHPTYMDDNPSSDKKPAVEPVRLDRAKLIKSVQVKPTVPLFITYYTLYPNENNVMTEYPDVYGFDSVIYHQLLNYLP
ncbi:peptidoglycan-binding protein [Hoylesella buccalis DNF00853]|uniref:Peptidoglycan-binding protein n=2 Tax=Hoylesella buccalis TaxID=28127 RepID=A0A095ZKM1_9BACT|nr:peptidoglycan-binding protein [Hoylesella buccalis DNF00853]